MTYDDAGLQNLIDASRMYDVGFSSLPGYWSGPLAANEYIVGQGGTAPLMSSYYQQIQKEDPSILDRLTSELSKIGIKDIAGLGLGALSQWGNYRAYKDDRDLKRGALDQADANRELAAGDDFAKMHALAQIIQARQGVNLDPSLAYAQAVREQMGLSPDGATEFAGVDIGGPMRIGMSSEDRLKAINNASGVSFAQGGLGRMGSLGLLKGGSPGQADDVNAKLSHGEYVFDADVVAALGDGNTEAGARKLDEMREAIRRHKRSAPADKIPPPAKGALAYLKKGK